MPFVALVQDSLLVELKVLLVDAATASDQREQRQLPSRHHLLYLRYFFFALSGHIYSIKSNGRLTSRSSACVGNEPMQGVSLVKLYSFSVSSVPDHSATAVTSQLVV